jgi:gamma-glutamyltranspeptidase/glutathione hydrolase
MVLGTPGGSRIFTSVFQVLADVYDFDRPLAAALEALRFHHQLLPQNTIYSEPYAPFPPALRKAVEARGYRVEAQDFNGDVEAIQVVGGVPHPASDPRGRGRALTAP